MIQVLPHASGRTAFGADPAHYAAARPPYPAEVYAALDARCPIAGARIFEIGPGSGLATLPLLARGPAALTAIEPDRRLAAYLGANPHPALTVVTEAWEDAEVPAESQDVGVAAMSFHWLEQDRALAKVHGALKPGGWWAMWWTLFGDPEEPDAFHHRSAPLFDRLETTPPSRLPGRRPFALDAEARLADLARAGFEACSASALRWNLRMDAGQVCALAATFSPVASAPAAVRERFLADLGALVERDFGGVVDRRFRTMAYFARKPREPAS